jgi:transposase
MNQYYSWFLGIDGGYDAHQICVMDATGSIVMERPVGHDAAAIQTAITAVLERTGPAPAQIAVAIETPRGAVVATLLERGVPIFALNPKQLDRFRDRHTVAGAKDDRRDALVLADSLRTDPRAFRRVQLDDAVILQLRELAHADDDLKRDLGRLTNRLRDQIYRVAPAVLTLCPAADEPWFWALLEHAATPDAQRALTRTDALGLLKRHRIRRLTAADVLAAAQAPAFYLAPGVVEATREAVELLLPQIRVVAAQLKRCEGRQEDLLATLRERPASEAEPGEHRDVEILESLPGVGRMVTVTMLVDATQPLATRDYARVRAHVGVAPITKASGKRRLVSMRYACHPRLREAAYHWGRVSLQQDAVSAAYYRRLRAQGHTHGRALRSLVDRWLRILVAMLRHRTLYAPNRFATPVVVPV